MKKKNEAVLNIKSDADASNFLEQMTELIKAASNGDNPTSINSDIAETLDEILKQYKDGDEHDPLSLLGLGEQGDPPADEFVEFFDFSSFAALGDEDNGSKAPTPDLVSSSSTNPSPESGSEADPAHHSQSSSTSSIKTEDYPDLLRLGPWKEIDGGESAYYQAGDFKWDSPIPTLEQPWAIFTS